jgi:hypothetical protein
MDEQPEVLSFGSERAPRWWHWPGTRGGISGGLSRRAEAVLAALLAACLAALGWTGVLLSQRDHTIADLRHALRTARQEPALTSLPAAPGYDGSQVLRFAGTATSRFEMVAVAIRPGPGVPETTWVNVSGRHVRPGQRYALLGGLCGGQFVTSTSLAQATANRAGDVTFAAADLEVSPGDSLAWVLVFAEQDGVTLGGIQGPFTGTGARPFLSRPRCGGL